MGVSQLVVNSLYDRYFDYKIFELFRDKLLTTINKFRKEEEITSIYSHLFMAPQELAGRKAFQLKGVALPFVCFWPLSYFDWIPEKYGQSVLSRDFSYLDENNERRGATGFLYHVQKEVAIYASSYFTDFTQQVSMDLMDFDRLRYFDIDCSQILPQCSTRVELLKKTMNVESKLDEISATRQFSLGAVFNLSLSFPVLNKDRFFDKVEIYINDNKEYEKLFV